MKPTSLRVITSLAIAAGGLGWSLAQLIYSWRSRMVVIGWGPSIAVGMLTAAIAIWVLLARPRLKRLKGALPLPPLVAARTAALALACSRTGAVCAGAYAGIFFSASLHLPAATSRKDMWTCGVVVIISVVLVVLALWLESLCRVKRGGDDDDRGSKSPIAPAGA
ncbi:MAG: DUF3180 domain-containing protein [Actinobacteria bacterium]|nr:DUF3180 domain-containing protein [Actinomycetota bacterium]